MLELFENMEMPLTLVLYHMEQAGIAVDKQALIQYGENSKWKNLGT
jgi:DNA polymerase I-like protein with 3'-5' exonuclease and polymerase domains